MYRTRNPCALNHASHETKRRRLPWVAGYGQKWEMRITVGCGWRDSRSGGKRMFIVPTEVYAQLGPSGTGLRRSHTPPLSYETALANVRFRKVTSSKGTRLAGGVIF